MTAKDYPVYDFLTASKVERPLSAALKVWLEKFAKMFGDRWKELAPTEINVMPLAIDSVTFESAQSKWTLPTIAVPIQINQGAVQGIIVAKRVDVLIILMEILCETMTERPADRELTTVETSLCQLFLEQSVATFGEAWPQKEILPIELGQLDHQPRRCRLFPPKNEVLVTGFDLQTSSGETIGPARVQWILSKAEMSALLGVETNSQMNTDSGPRIPVENISQIRVDVCAKLGSTELDMNDLMQLGPGDIIKLDQRIESPVVLLVNDRPVFQAWPGRLADKRCLQVENFHFLKKLMSPNPESTDPAVDPQQSAAETATPTPEVETANQESGETSGVEVQTPEFQEFAGQEGVHAQNEIGRFHDIRVTVSAELGRTSIPIQKLLSLGSGSVLELDRSIDSPIELIAQGVPLASGEVVVVDDCFAIRITEVYPNNQGS